MVGLKNRIKNRKKIQWSKEKGQTEKLYAENQRLNNTKKQGLTQVFCAQRSIIF